MQLVWEPLTFQLQMQITQPSPELHCEESQRKSKTGSFHHRHTGIGV